MGVFEGILALALATVAPAPPNDQDELIARDRARTITWGEQLLHSSRPRDRALGASFFALERSVAPDRGAALRQAARAMFFPVHDLIKQCKPAEGAPEARVADCRAVGERMMGSNSLLEQLLGRALASAAGGGEYASRDRQLKWLRAASAEANPGGVDAQYFADVLSTDSEMRAIELSLQRRGLPLEPPADWSYAQWESDWLAKAAAARDAAATSTGPGDR